MSAPASLSEALLEELEGRWRRQGAPLREHLQPGLADEEIDQLASSIGLRLPREARVWWGWHDGARPTERALAKVDHWWRDTWLPILGTGHGPVIACDCATPDESLTPVFEVDWHGGGGRTEPSARSFGEAVSWWIEAFDDGVWVFERGRWELHRERLADPQREFTRLV